MTNDRVAIPRIFGMAPALGPPKPGLLCDAYRTRLSTRQAAGAQAARKDVDPCHGRSLLAPAGPGWVMRTAEKGAAADRASRSLTPFHRRAAGTSPHRGAEALA